MQFHLDGYRPGDPRVADPTRALPETVRPRPLPAEVDVLIVGCGPTGLTVAAQLAQFAGPDGISVAIADLKADPLRLGQADGIACRSMEMFQAFGFADRVQAESYWVNETVFWKPDPAHPDRIARSGRIQDVEDGLSEFPHVILNQARVHDFFLETMRNSPGGLVPHYSRRLVHLDLPTEPGSPVVAHFECLESGSDDDRRIEVVRARYVVGCDGARSGVRRFMGRTLTGDAANQAWGVMDVLATTDFPDIRFKAVVHSNKQGNLLVIPREGGYMFRLYIELDKLGEDERVADHEIGIDQLIAAGQRILAPYTLDVHEVAWWSVYEIGQRICDKFDDVPTGTDRLPRVFIAGDACHTHSPKAGQGMNVSMRDGFNLGWKLAAVLQQRCRPEILNTYSAERWAVAKQLIDFDRYFAKMFSAPPKSSDDDSEGVDPAEFQQAFEQAGRFTAGVVTTYEPSLIVAGSENQDLAGGFVVGARFHSAPVLRVADAKPVNLGHVVQADGRWRLFAFADEAGAGAASRVGALGRFLLDSDESPIRRFTPPGADIDSVIDVRAVLPQAHTQVVLADLVPILLPSKGRYGLTDYQKVFCPDPDAAGDIFDMRGIDRAAGAVVIVRPDQHVAAVFPLDAHSEIAAFFARFMIEAGT